MFWDIKQTLSYNKLMNFIVGSRGSGKSYGCKEWCIDDFLAHKKQFIWVRRFKSEFDDFKTTFFNDIRHKYESHEFEIVASENSFRFLVDGEVMGYGIPLSISLKKKSIPYTTVDKIIFDEFIIEKGSSWYLNNEVEVFLDLMETVIRLRTDFKCSIFIANAITFTNPYFLYFRLTKPMNKKNIISKGDTLLQFVANKEFIEAKKRTRFGKLIEGTNYAKYSIDNEFLRDNNNFICKPYKKMRYYFTLKANNEMYGVYMVMDEGVMYVSDHYDPSYKLIYTTILKNHQPNTLLLKGTKSPPFKRFVDEFKRGNVRFRNIKIKNIVLESVINMI